MDILERLILRTGDSNEELLADCIETAKYAILARRFPYGEYPVRETADSTDENPVTETYVEDRYLDLQFRIALDLYNKQGAEGEKAHGENGISRTYESSWISEQLLREVTPFVGAVK